jgi:hypothetical protein
MGKVAKLLPEKYKQKAIENNIPIQTVYYRLNKNWDIEKAVTQKPKQTIKRHRDKEGQIISERPKSHLYSFTFYDDKQELLDKAIEESGKTKSQFIADILEEYLIKWAKKKERIKTKK